MRLTTHLLLLWLANACASTPTTPTDNSTRQLQAIGNLGAVATASPQATKVALAILERGGTAADAAIAAALVLGVTEPYSAGLGGGGFAMIHDAAAKQQFALDFRERAPGAATSTMYQDKSGKVIKRASLDGWKAIAVPGTAAGLEALYKLKLEGRGTLPWADLAKPAIRIAAEGFPVTPLLHQRIVSRRKALSADPEASRLFLPAGKPLQPGDLLIQTDLAETLGRLAELGAMDWKHGVTAERITAAAGAGGGILSESDFANYRVHWRKPLRASYHAHEVVSFPPPSSGGVHLLQMLALLDRETITKDPQDPLFEHRRIEIMRRAYQDRSRHLGDPDFYPVPIQGLLAASHIKALHASIGDEPTASKALDNPQPPGSKMGVASPMNESASTTHLTVVDRLGNAVAMTFTINYGFGAAVIAPGTGVLLNDEMDDFSAAPGTPNAYGLVGGEANAIAPGKTPLSSMTPTLVLNRAGELRLAVGSPGGSTIITTVLQILLHVIDREMTLAQAIEQPRLHHQWLPDCVFVDPGKHKSTTLHALKAKGHCVKARRSIGNAHGVLVQSDGRYEAAADPRGEGTAAALNKAKATP